MKRGPTNKVMRIVLIRHGRPAFSSQKPISSVEFKQWIDAYNSSDLCDRLSPSQAICQLAQDCNTVVCSTLPRSLSSAKCLGVKEVGIIRNHQFREMEMPWGRLSGVKLKPTYWAVIFRLLWFFGYSKNSESCKDAIARAGQAAFTLESMAKESGSVLFVGHGLLNRVIVTSLIKNGWQATRKLDGKYWGVGIFEREV